MGSEGNKVVNDGTSFQPSEPALCANGCGFFGSASTMNLCSKCYRDLRIEEEQKASAKAAMDKFMHPNHSQSQSQPQIDAHIGLGSSSSSAAPSDSSLAMETAAAAISSSNRCLSCRKKVGVMGFKCRCGSTFCGTHRYPEKHGCTFDFKSRGREAIAKANPVVKADRMERRI